MKLIIINQFFYPDIDVDAQFAYDLAKGFVEKGYKVRVLCQRSLKDDTSKTLKRKETINGIEIYRLPNAFSNINFIRRFIRHIFFYIGLLIKLVSSTSRDSRLLIATSPPLNGLIAAIIKPFKNFKYLLAVKDVYPDAMVSLGIIKYNGLIYKILNLAIEISYRKANKILSLGSYMTKRIKNKGVGKDKIVEIPNWGFDHLCPLAREENTFIEKMNLEGKFIVLYSGNHGYGHEFDTVLEGAKRLSTEYDDIYFVFIGGGKRFNEIKDFRRDNPDANILMFSYLPFEKLNYGLNLAHISLITMRDKWEGVMVSSKTYGIMAVGSPIVYVGPESDTSLTIKKYNCGFIIRNGCVNDFVDKIKKLYHNEKLRKEMGSNARNGYENEFTKNKVIDKYLAVLEFGI